MDFNEIDLSTPGAGAKTVATESENAQSAVEAQTEATPTAPEAAAAVVSHVQDVLEPAITEKVTQTLHKRDIAQVAPELLSPQALGLVNTMVAAAVKEAVSAAMSSVIPALERINAPTPLEAEQAEQIFKNRERAKREKAQMMIQEEENRKNDLARKANCTHRDQKSGESIALVRNWPDRQPRGICMRCNLQVHPREYRCPLPPVTMEQALSWLAIVQQTDVSWLGATPYVDPKTKLVTHFLVNEHPLYFRVREALEREAMALAG